MINEKEYAKHGTIVVRDCAKQEYLRVLQLIGLAWESKDDSQEMDDYISILNCERKDLAEILNKCEEIASYIEKPGIVQEKKEEEFSDF